ncbi:mitochondrial inner membrane protease subunit 2 isoform X2 [Canis aureus]
MLARQSGKDARSRWQAFRRRDVTPATNHLELALAWFVFAFFFFFSIMQGYCCFAKCVKSLWNSSMGKRRAVEKSFKMEQNSRRTRRICSKNKAAQKRENQGSFLSDSLCIKQSVNVQQVSLGLLHAHATHILWPPERWQKLESVLPPERLPVQREEE